MSGATAPASRRWWSAETTASVAVGATLLLALFALIAPLRADVRDLRAELRTEVAAIRADLHALSERVARIEGALSGPYRLLAPAAAEAADE
ncbi:MAG: hypothetical protein OXQ31_19515 [Spirochaetaceae bacterium]|nr:hypothetical protein [Spirochaetaceae bacterium]